MTANNQRALANIRHTIRHTETIALLCGISTEVDQTGRDVLLGIADALGAIGDHLAAVIEEWNPGLEARP